MKIDKTVWIEGEEVEVIGVMGDITIYKYKSSWDGQENLFVCAGDDVLGKVFISSDSPDGRSTIDVCKCTDLTNE